MGKFNLGRTFMFGICHKSTQTNIGDLVFDQNNYGDKGWKLCVGEDMYWNIQHSFIGVRKCHIPKKHNWWSS